MLRMSKMMLLSCWNWKLEMRYSFCPFEKDHVYETHSCLQYEHHFSDFREIFLKHVHNLLECKKKTLAFTGWRWTQLKPAIWNNLKPWGTSVWLSLNTTFLTFFLAQRCYYGFNLGFNSQFFNSFCKLEVESERREVRLNGKFIIQYSS